MLVHGLANPGKTNPNHDGHGQLPSATCVMDYGSFYLSHVSQPRSMKAADQLMTGSFGFLFAISRPSRNAGVDVVRMRESMIVKLLKSYIVLSEYSEFVLLGPLPACSC